MPNLLLEIGCEEIPARQLDLAMTWLAAQVPARLAAARIGCGAVRVMGTPRRLSFIASDVATDQRNEEERVVGPSVSAAFGPDGAPTKAAQAFASKNGLDLAACERVAVEGKKGEYLVGVRKSQGRPTLEQLPALLTALVGEIPWGKSMRWAGGEARFVRPVHWLLARFGERAVPFAWMGLQSGTTTRGHRFLAPDAIDIANAEAYVEALRKAFVLVDPSERKAAIEAELARASQASKLQIVADADLLAEVCNLVEYPRAVVGTFNADYLEVPSPVIITAMRTHQRYFAVQDGAGALAPAFVTIAGTITKQDDLVRSGNETVLASRLSDAQYFYRLDKRTPLEAWNKKLASVVFQAKLGDAAKTYANKVARVTTLAERIAVATGADVAVVRAAAQHCKADLMSGVVGEFPELQGTMGKYYATAPLGAAVGAAIEEHYWPKGAGAALPQTPEAAAVSIADRLDTLVGCFASGLEPSGSADPYALRRAAIGVISVLLDQAATKASWRLGISQLIAWAQEAFAGTLAVNPAHVASLRAFFKTRFRGVLLEAGVAPQDADATLGGEWDDLHDASARARSIATVPAAARELFKRIANILDDAGKKGQTPAGAIDTALFAESGNVEWKLHAAYTDIAPRIEQAAGRGDYAELFAAVATLSAPVMAFFDKGGVMVMDPNPKIANNRLLLISSVIAPLARVCDFRLAAGNAGGGAGG